MWRLRAVRTDHCLRRRRRRRRQPPPAQAAPVPCGVRARAVTLSEREGEVPSTVKRRETTELGGQRSGCRNRRGHNAAADWKHNELGEYHVEGVM